MIYELIKNRTPFALARYGDGELALIQGRGVPYETQAGIMDEWTSPPGLNSLGLALRKTLLHTESNYFYGLPLFEPLYSEFKRFISSNNIVDANFFINENWPTFNAFDWGEHILVSRENGTVESPPDCVKNWELLLERLEPYLTREGELFLFSAGPMSCVAIDWMWNQNPTNMYIDVGSATDFRTKKRITRGFM